MVNILYSINLIHLSTKLSIQALDYYLQKLSEPGETKKICLKLKNFFMILETSIISGEYKNLTEFYKSNLFINSININTFEKDKKTNTLVFNSKKLIDENLHSENLENLNFIIKNIKKFIEKDDVKFYLQKNQNKFLAATTKEKKCNFQSLLHSNSDYPICYIYNPFFTIEVCSSMVRIIINYSYCSSLLLIEFNFNEMQ